MKKLLTLSTLSVASIVAAGAIGLTTVPSTASANASSQAVQRNNVSSDSFSKNLTQTMKWYRGQLTVMENDAKRSVKRDPFLAFRIATSPSLMKHMQTYEKSVNDASQEFYTAAVHAKNTATSHDQFIAAYDSAKSRYMNQLESAKNHFMNGAGSLGNRGDAMKNRYLDQYNRVTAHYSQKLENIKQ